MVPNGYPPLHWLWPTIYALHPVTVLAGAPIVFSGRWEPVNVLLPVAGYGLLTAFAGHIYSRYALKRLREAAR